MENNNCGKKLTGNLRKRALEILHERPQDLTGLPASDVKNLAHELSVCQVALEIQNEQLRDGQTVIERSCREYADLYDFAPIGYLTLTTGGIIQKANLTAATMLGQERAYLLRQPFSKFIIKEDTDVCCLHRQKVLDTKKMQECELRIKKPDSSTFWVHMRCQPVIDEEGHVAQIRSVISNITERKQAELELKEYSSNLEAMVEDRTKALAAVNKEIESFAYSVSHDLKAPLRTIDGFSKVLLEDHLDKFDDECKDCLTRICAASERMDQLITDILKLSKLTKTEIVSENVDLAKLASGIISDLREHYPDRHVTFTSPDSAPVEGNPALLAALMQNLIDNAWKFSSKRGHAHIEFDAKAQDGQIVYSIRDDGAGFDMADADKIFAPFQRLHSNEEFPGTGVGLATVQRVINRHHGRIWAEGQVDKGAVFYFTLSDKKYSPKKDVLQLQGIL